MSPWLLWTLVFLVGASVTRLITDDKILEPLRDRWHTRYVRRGVETLKDAEAAELVPGTHYDNPDAVRAMRVRVYDEARAGHPFWRRVAWRLDWAETKSTLVQCGWCVSFWVYLAGVLITWMAVLDFPGHILGGPTWLMIPALALALRWLYGITATWLDR
jgi:hypothetical protein